MKSFNEPAQNVPLLDDVDVVVCGAGPAGCSAAIAAARLGARTLLLERDGYLGGATVSQLVAHILSTNAMDFQGIWHEWIHAIRRRRTDAVAPLIGTPGKYFFRSGVDPEVVKFAWQDLLDAAGVEVLFHTWASNAALDGSTCLGVVAETCAGRRAILAKRVIDCTGNGSVCAAAGVPFTHGNGTDNWNQAMTMVYRMANVQWPEKGYSGADMDRIKALAREHAEPTGPTTPVLTNGRVANYAMANWVHQSVAPYRKEMNVFSSRILKVDPLDPRELSRAEREGRDQAWQCAEFIRRNIPGFEQSYLLDTGAHVGLRDSRRIQGLATVTADDAWQFRKYDDGIARSSWDIDIWPGDSYDKPAVPREEADYKQHMERLGAGDYFDIRYGALIAAGVDNLLVAGRCLSAEREAEASLRIQQTCASTGQAAGVAAALSLRDNVPPRVLDAGKVVTQLAADRASVEPAWPILATS
jgi:hypothetical protein